MKTCSLLVLVVWLVLGPLEHCEAGFTLYASVGNQLVSYDASGTSTTIATVTGYSTGPGEIAANSAGDIYYYPNGNYGIAEFSATGTLLARTAPGVFETAGAGGLAIGPSGNVYALNGGEGNIVYTFSSSLGSVGLFSPVGNFDP